MIWVMEYGGQCVVLRVASSDSLQRLAEGPTLDGALIAAEHALRIDLDDIQSRLTAERERLGDVKHSDDRR